MLQGTCVCRHYFPEIPVSFLWDVFLEAGLQYPMVTLVSNSWAISILYSTAAAPFHILIQSALSQDKSGVLISPHFQSICTVWFWGVDPFVLRGLGCHYAYLSHLHKQSPSEAEQRHPLWHPSLREVYYSGGQLCGPHSLHFRSFMGTISHQSIFLKYFIYLFLRDTKTHTEAET